MPARRSSRAGHDVRDASSRGAAAGLIRDASPRRGVAGRAARTPSPSVRRLTSSSAPTGNGSRISERRTAEGGIVGVFTDITELKERELQLGELVDRLADARDEAMQATLAKSRFLATMSHELRTPLNAVIGITEMLIEDAEESRQADLLEPLGRIGRAGKHLLELINDVLDLSKIEAGKLEFHYEDIDLGALVDDVIGAAEPLAGATAIASWSSAPDDIGTMRSDATRLRQIMLNLSATPASSRTRAPSRSRSREPRGWRGMARSSRRPTPASA